GIPKGAMLTHASLYANTQQILVWAKDLEPGKQRTLGVLPLFHVFAMMTVLHIGVALGATMILHPRFNLKSVLKDTSRKKPTILPGVPTMFAAIADAPDISRYDLTSLKLCISGGAPLPADVRRRFEKNTRAHLVEGYGLTEASPVVCANPFFGKQKDGSIGLPLPQTEIAIEDPEKPEHFLPQGERGELCVRGPQVMKGYWRRPYETDDVMIKEGWLRTGDIAYMDEEGYVFIVDRRKEMIISGGYNIYPRTIEEVLYKHPAVREAAVIGIPHPKWGQVPQAYIALAEGKSVTQQELHHYLRERLAAFEIPKEFIFRKDLPKTLIGKIDKKVLQPKEDDHV
ncbi:MAG: AMP-binding protein, partial [Rickettsiales bacterium]|nr:AMP-binding protein [Rickettsiales bacterium]